MSSLCVFEAEAEKQCKRPGLWNKSVVDAMICYFMQVSTLCVVDVV